MKKRILIVPALLLGLTMVVPCVSDARRGGGGGHHGGGYRSHGWHGPRVYVRPAVISPWYYYPSPYYAPAYVVPPPDAYAYPAPPPAYAYPDPPVTNGYGNSAPTGYPEEWVTVPGQWVNGMWVGEHRVRVSPGR